MMVVLNELSKGSSSSSPTSDHRYDVFLSFRGVDTRHSFTDHLYKALLDADINTFLDDERIQTGEDLKPELERAIKTSKASVIVLSKNYASSTWCLDELVLILEQSRNSTHIAIPIFYHVEPTDVRKQQNTFGDALAKHKQRMDAETNVEKRSQRALKIEVWKEALKEVAGLKGKDAKGRPETKFIEEIVEEITVRLGIHLRGDLPSLIGMDYHIEFVTSWLKDGSSHTVDILTIWGMGGIGKTSLAKYVHGSHCREFDKSSFLEDIGRRCTEQFSGLLDLQKQLFDDISKRSPIQVRDAYVYTYKIENAFLGKKVFLVLDDIDNFKQLDALLGRKGFHPGSKIIITTKDGSLTENCALFASIVQPKHTKHLLEGLYETASLMLLSSHAFTCNDPKNGYEKVSEKLVKYCGGHPLALEVLGRSLRNRDVAEWEDYLQVLEKETNPHIQNVLQVSFDTLSSTNDKELFKHIACFFVGKDKGFTETILKACGIRTLLGITNLIGRCLLKIGPRNELMMHQLLQEMGRDVVQQESPMKPWKRSRLWRHEESFNVLKQKRGEGNIQGLVLDMKMLEKVKSRSSFELKTETFSRMDNLMLLELNHVQLSGLYKNFPEELRCLCMHGFPLDHIPSDLSMENLVALDMSYSNFKVLDMSYSNSHHGKRQKLTGSCSKRKRLLGSLKILNLSFCDQLHSICDFSELPALERLTLASCVSLMEVCESIGQCIELVLIDLSYCKKLKKLPRSIGKLKKVRTLSLDGCSDLGEFPIEMKDMESLEVLNAKNISINSQTSSSAVVDIVPRSPKSFFPFLPPSLVTLSLENNNLVNESFPMSLSSLFMLKKLYLDGNLIVSLPNCVKNLGKLEFLSLNSCDMLKTVENPPNTLRRLKLEKCSSLVKVTFDPEMSTPILPILEYRSSTSLNEIEGIIKMQPIAHVQEEVLCGLGWADLEFDPNQEVMTWHLVKGLGPTLQIQMYYEFGIFSTFYGGKELPKWISHRSERSSVSFTVPLSPNNIRGLNLCSVHRASNIKKDVFLSDIMISNITKNCTWVYSHYIYSVRVVDEEYVVCLSHWMFSKNELDDGDIVVVTIASCECGDEDGMEEEEDLNETAIEKEEDGDEVIIEAGIDDYYGIEVTECGISLVYDNGKMEQDPLGYYKSWNHIISGDVSGFQLTTGEYFLTNIRFFDHNHEVNEPHYHPLVPVGACYKDKEVCFSAFAHRESGVLDGTSGSGERQRVTT